MRDGGGETISRLKETGSWMGLGTSDDFEIEISGEVGARDCSIESEIVQQEIQFLQLNFTAYFRVQHIASALRDLQFILRKRGEKIPLLRAFKCTLWSLVFAAIWVVETVFFPRVYLSNVILQKISYYGFFVPWFLGSPELRASMAPHFSGWIVLFGIVPLPFFRVQLPSVLVPFLSSGHLHDLCVDKHDALGAWFGEQPLEEVLGRHSGSQQPSKTPAPPSTAEPAHSKKEPKQGLLARIEVTKVPIQALLSTILRMTVGWDVSAGGSVLFPRKVQVLLNLPDHSRALIDADAPRRCSNVELRARGGYVLPPGSELDAREFKKMFVTIEHGEVDGQHLFAGASTGGSEGDAATRGTVQAGEREDECGDDEQVLARLLARRNTLVLEHHSTTIWECVSEVLSWAVLMGHETFDQSKVELFLQTISGQGSEGEGAPGTAGMRETVGAFFAKCEHFAEGHAQQGPELFSSGTADAATEDRVLAELAVSDDAFCEASHVDDVVRTRGQGPADMDPDHVRRSVIGYMRKRLLRKQLLEQKRGRILLLLRSFQISGNVEACPDFVFAVEPWQSTGGDAGDGDRGGAEAHGKCIQEVFPRVRMTYERPDMTGGMEVESQMRGVRVGKLAIITSKLWQLGTRKHHNFLRIPHLLDLQICVEGLQLRRVVLDDSVTRLELATQPGAVHISGQTCHDLAGFDGKRGVTWQLASSSGCISGQQPAPGALRFEAAGTTPVTSEMEVPEFEVMSAYGVPVETRLAGALQWTLLAKCGHQRSASSVQDRGAGGSMEGKTINLVHLQGTTAKLFLSRAEVSYGRRALYLDGEGYSLEGMQQGGLSILAAQANGQPAFEASSIPSAAAAAGSVEGCEPAGKPTFELTLLEAQISDGAAEPWHSISPVSPMRLQLAWNLRKGTWQEPSDYSQLLLLADSSVPEDVTSRVTRDALRVARQCASNMDLVDALDSIVFGNEDAGIGYDAPVDDECHTPTAGMRRVNSRRSHGSCKSMVDLRHDELADNDLLVSFPEDDDEEEGAASPLERFWRGAGSLALPRKPPAAGSQRTTAAGQNFLRTSLGRGATDRRQSESRRNLGVDELQAFAENAELEALHALRKQTSTSSGDARSGSEGISPLSDDSGREGSSLPRSTGGGILLFDAKLGMAVNVLPQFLCEGRVHVAITSGGQISVDALEPWLLRESDSVDEDDVSEHEREKAETVRKMLEASQLLPGMKRGVNADATSSDAGQEQHQIAMQVLRAGDVATANAVLRQAAARTGKQDTRCIANEVLSVLYDFAWGCPVRFVFLAVSKRALIEHLFCVAAETSAAATQKHFHLPYQVMQRWIDKDSLVAGPFATLAVLGSQDLYAVAKKGLGLLRRVVRIAEQMEIEQPADLIPVDRLATFAFNALFSQDGELVQTNTEADGAGGSELASAESAVRSMLASVIRGDGLDINGAKSILSQALPIWYAEHLFELDRGLRIVNKILSPYAPMPAIQPSNDHTLKNVSDQLSHELASLPTAKDLYDRRYYEDEGEHARPQQRSPAVQRMRLVVALAPYLTRSQLCFIVAQHRAALQSWSMAPQVGRGYQRMKYVAHLKASLAQIVDDYGGFSFVPQTHAIAFLLGDTLQRSEAEQSSVTTDQYGSALLGPEDMAGLMRALLSAVVQGHSVQRGLRLLLQILLKQPKIYVTGVFYEMSVNGSQRLLAGLLMRLFDVSQASFRKQWDYLSILGGLLGMPLPRRADYMAGGKYQRRSYYEAVYQIAANIIDDSADYLGLKFWLTANVEMHNLVVPDKVRFDEIVHAGDSPQANSSLPDKFQDLLASAPYQRLVETALSSILEADEAGRKVFKSQPASETQQRASAVQAYARSFEACRAVVAHDRRSLFRLPWLKAFYERNYEALVVRTVVGNIMDGVDDVRAWLQTQPCAAAAGLTGEDLSCMIEEGSALDASETRSIVVSDRLLSLVLDAVYLHPADRRRLLADPLVRLLLADSATEGSRLDFTIVSGMGVITEGRAGQELQRSLERLQRRHGVSFVRANTGTARHLEYNARQIEEAVRQVRTQHWGWVGYSQGCANQWKAEATLATGTPEEQRLLDGLVCRNVLYSAANGTPHSTCAEWKLSEAAVALELELKKYQLQVSHNLVSAALRAIQTAFATREVVFLLSGMHTLNHMGVLRGIWWGGVHKPHVPTCAVRAVISGDGSNFPEVLTQLANALTKQERNVPLVGPKPASPAPGPEDALAPPSRWVRACVDSGQPPPAGIAVDRLVAAYVGQLRGESNARWNALLSKAGGGVQSDALAPSEPDLDPAPRALAHVAESSGVHNLADIPQHDTQVTAFEAQGYPVYVCNRNGVMLQRCAVENMVHRGHHWAPLTAAETGFITTSADDRQGVNMGSRDKHVFPWVLVNARFGIIPAAPSAQG